MKFFRHRSLVTATLLAALLSPAAMAHPGHEAGTSLFAGLIHPLTGLDHALFIVAVGAWAAQLTMHSRVLVWLMLASSITVGALLPGRPLTGAGLEMALALTVVGAGLLLAFGRRIPVVVAGVLTAGFALFHGMAHGIEGPSGSIVYVPGLAIATAALAAGASWAAAMLFTQGQQWWVRIAGVVSALTGAAMLA